MTEKTKIKQDKYKLKKLETVLIKKTIKKLEPLKTKKH